jgi:hypothetical protein
LSEAGGHFLPLGVGEHSVTFPPYDERQHLQMGKLMVGSNRISDPHPSAKKWPELCTTKTTHGTYVVINK